MNEIAGPLRWLRIRRSRPSATLLHMPDNTYAMVWLLAMMMDSRLSALLDFEQAAPQRRFDAELRRNGAARRSEPGVCSVPLSNFTRLNNTRIAQEFAHRSQPGLCRS